MDPNLAAKLDSMLDGLTTLSPNHVDDWLEIQHKVLDRLRDDMVVVSDDDLVEYFTDRGLEQDDVAELRRRIRVTLRRS